MSEWLRANTLAWVNNWHAANDELNELNELVHWQLKIHVERHLLGVHIFDFADMRRGEIRERLGS